MLDYFCVFTKGGVLLWAMSFAPLRGDPVNALVRTCLLEERSGEREFAYTSPAGGAHTLKWALNNVRGQGQGGRCGGQSWAEPLGRSLLLVLYCSGTHCRSLRLTSLRHFLTMLTPSPASTPSLQTLGLVFVAVYQRALKLTYVGDLLDRAGKAFAPRFRPNCWEYPEFDAPFQRLLLEAEERADAAKRPSAAAAAAAAAPPTLAQAQGRGRGHAGDADGEKKEGKGKGGGANGKAAPAGGSSGSESGAEYAAAAGGGGSTADSGSDGGGGGAFNAELIRKRLAARKGAPGAKKDSTKAAAALASSAGDKKGKPKGKVARVWGAGGGVGGEKEEGPLDFTDGAGAEGGGAVHAVHAAADFSERSMVDVEDEGRARRRRRRTR